MMKLKATTRSGDFPKTEEAKKRGSLRKRASPFDTALLFILDTIPIRGILEPNRDASLRRESMRYADVSRKEKKCLDFTSLTVEEFEELVPIFEEEFQEYMKTHCLDGKERVGR